jgi:hypothetical protein
MEDDFRDSLRMSLLLSYRLSSVDIPEGNSAFAIARYAERVVPLKFGHCILMAIEQTLTALQGV